MAQLLLINGPNLNLLGQREPEIYGSVTLDDIETRMDLLAQERQHKLLCYQSDAEHELLRQIHTASERNPRQRFAGRSLAINGSQESQAGRSLAGEHGICRWCSR